MLLTGEKYPPLCTIISAASLQGQSFNICTTSTWARVLTSVPFIAHNKSFSCSCLHRGLSSIFFTYKKQWYFFLTITINKRNLWNKLNTEQIVKLIWKNRKIEKWEFLRCFTFSFNISLPFWRNYPKPFLIINYPRNILFSNCCSTISHSHKCMLT